jgi:uncharacterized DUF497 family protein
VEFEWDEDKRLRNAEKHDIDFEHAAEIFDGRAIVTVPSTFPDEARFQTTAELEDRVITVIWTWRQDRIRIVSARRARKNEQSLLNSARRSRSAPPGTSMY